MVTVLEMGADVTPVISEGQLAKLGPQCDMVIKHWALSDPS